MSVKSPRVLIIGAGIAGLAAARTLIQGGIRDVHIYEARDRIGGRIHTVPHGTSYIEEGGQWVMGDHGNPIFELANEQGLVATPIDDEESQQYLTQDGGLLDSTLLVEIQAFWETAVDEATNLPPGSPDDSMKAYFDKKFHELFNTFCDDSDVNRERKAVYQLLQRFESANCAANFDCLSLASLRNEELPGCQQLLLNTGFSSIIDIIAQPIPSSSIHLDSPVTNIYWSPESHTKDGAVALEIKKGEVVAGDHIICTIPVGVFKESASDLFQPSLPADRMKVLDRIGFGTLNKIFLEWEESWWASSHKWWIFVWREDMHFEIESLKDTDYYKQNVGKEWFRQIYAFTRVSSQPNMLVGFIAGDAAITLEQISDEEVIDVGTAIFRRFTGDSEIPRPKCVRRSRWGSDPYSKGSYVYHRLNAQFEDFDSLANPLPSSQEPLLQFAGEGFISRFIGTTHGAFFSGEQAAKVILDAQGTRDVTI